MVTFIKLKSNGMWGVKVAGSGNIATARPGAGFVVTKRDGSTTQVTLAAKEDSRTDLGYEVWSIVETRPAGRSRGYYPRARRASGEQASFASQSAPYDLAPVYEMETRYDAKITSSQPNVQNLKREPFTNDYPEDAVVAAENDDPALVFQRLLGGTYTPGESSVRDAARGGQ
jgi:hypothetical protein